MDHEKSTIQLMHPLMPVRCVLIAFDLFTLLVCQSPFASTLVGFGFECMYALLLIFVSLSYEPSLRPPFTVIVSVSKHSDWQESNKYKIHKQIIYN